MYRLRSNGDRSSIICSIRCMPRVVSVRACVSPRVKIPEPWTRGTTPISVQIGRTSSVLRPSRRTFSSRMRFRTSFFVSDRNAAFTSNPLVELVGEVDEERICGIVSGRCALGLSRRGGELLLQGNGLGDEGLRGLDPLGEQLLVGSGGAGLYELDHVLRPAGLDHHYVDLAGGIVPTGDDDFDCRL